MKRGPVSKVLLVALALNGDRHDLDALNKNIAETTAHSQGVSSPMSDRFHVLLAKAAHNSNARICVAIYLECF
jgi:hypothetical protein